MGSMSVSFQHSHVGGSQRTSDPLLNIELDSPQWLLDGKQLTAKEASSHSGKKTIVSRSSRVNEHLHLVEQVRDDACFEGIVGQSPALRLVLRLIETVATGD